MRPTSSSAIRRSLFTVPFCRAMEATCEDPEQATNALLESGRIAMSSGCWQMGSVARTRSALASIRRHGIVGAIADHDRGTVRRNPRQSRGSAYAYVADHHAASRDRSR